MKVGIPGPISTESIAQFLHMGSALLPSGYSGAPFLGTLIGALLEYGHKVSAYTTTVDLPLDNPARFRFQLTVSANLWR